tara:strand:+ start:283 stop:531 length:249 start_codon:yes stop_codon:yes gene_type:complete
MEPTLYLDQVASTEGMAHAFEFAIAMIDHSWYDSNFVYITSDIPYELALIVAEEYANEVFKEPGIAFIAFYSHDLKQISEEF